LNIYELTYSQLLSGGGDLFQTSNQFRNSLFNFIDQVFKHDKYVNILVLGCGLGQTCFYLYEKLNLRKLNDPYFQFTITGIDSSSTAISLAKKKWHQFSEISFHELSIENLFLNKNYYQQFCLVVDDHLLHCLTLQTERESYFNVLDWVLKAEGKVIIETLILDESINLEGSPKQNFYFCPKELILWQKINETLGFMPIRKILRGYDLEQEVKRSSVLKIHYFSFMAQLKFQIPNWFEMDVMRMILQKN
jgi:SAM-dependent methyltransferase